MNVIPFSNAQLALTEKFKSISNGPLFRVDLDKDVLWNLYLDSFHPEMNKVFRKRREYDCSCCKQFVRAMGNVVYLTDDYKIKSLWRMPVGGQFQPSFDAMAEYVESFPISDVFLTAEKTVGTLKNIELLGGGATHIWEHFFLNIPLSFQVNANINLPDLLNEYRVSQALYFRAHTEIKLEAIEKVTTLINEGKVYKGDTNKANLLKYAAERASLLILKEARGFTDYDIMKYCWKRVASTPIETGKAYFRIKNSSIGTLLCDLSDGKPVEEALAAYTKITDTNNYRRSTATASTSMIKSAKETLQQEGLMSVFNRRLATPSDIKASNLFYVDRSTSLPIDPFKSLEDSRKVSGKILEASEELTFTDFTEKVLPIVKSLDVLFENSKANNLMTLVAPESPEDPLILSWDNNFSWFYKGDVTDALKERVKKAGGCVVGDLRISLGWNNGDDLDLSVDEPSGYLVYYRDKRSRRTGGFLDVDMNAFGIDSRNPVENIIYTHKNKMTSGDYDVYVTNYKQRERTDFGFTVEIEAEGKVRTFRHDGMLPDDDKVRVATVIYDANGEFSIKGFIPEISGDSSVNRKVWNLYTERFHKVSMAMLSPNHWESERGHKHYFFILDGCRCDEKVRRFYNEFLRADLNKHRKVLEAVGTTNMIVPEKEEQVSGLGFSITSGASAYLRVDNRKIYKVTF